MMKKTAVSALVALGFIQFNQSASALELVFEEDFDGTTLGENQSDFGNFVLSGGVADIIGPGLFDLYPGNGNYVDLEGSSNLFGELTGTSSVAGIGTAELQFDLANNYVGGTPNSVTVSVGSFFTETIEIETNPVSFTTFVRTFDITSNGATDIVFRGVGNDVFGVLLDNVSLFATPFVAGTGSGTPTTGGGTPTIGGGTGSVQVGEPASFVLLGLGLSGLVCARRRKTYFQAA